MHIPVNAIRIAQSRLARAGLRPGPIDGELDASTAAALDAALGPRRDDLAAEHAVAILDGARRRRLTAYVQLLARDAGLDSGKIDGFWGPQTDYAFDQLEHLETFGELPHPWRDFDGPEANPNHWPLETEAELASVYGAPAHPPLATIHSPYRLRLSWNLAQTTGSITCHRRVADSLGRILAGVLDHYGEDGIRELRLDRYGGCFNPRRKRGGTSWSTHAWGIALDFDPERNRLSWGRDRAWLARPEYRRWWELWEEEGWVSLGRVANFDWMHVQAARRG